MPGSVDLNADVAESFGRWTLGDDAALIPFLTSANVAGGFHAGDPATIRRACALAVSHGVGIGAQVAYRDLAGFGRRFVDVEHDDLAADVAYQIGAVQALARAEGGAVRHVKAHGALYHAVHEHEEQAAAVVAGVAAVDSSLAVVGFPGGRLAEAARRTGLRVVVEGFADRRYDGAGRLVDRRLPGAVLADPAAAAAQAVALARSGAVGTVCVHGDTPGAVAIARAVRAGLVAAGIELRALAAP
ncbi:MAG: 5-oxoprolinase subunit PxpA [Kineosporiaceae bacterium]